MKNYKYILFDLDGTITDSALGITNSVKYALNKLNAPIPPYETLCKFIGPPLLDGFREFCGFNKVPMMCYQELDVPNSLKMCLRILLNINTNKTRKTNNNIFVCFYLLIFFVNL